jgi:hypothetical protein
VSPRNSGQIILDTNGLIEHYWAMEQQLIANPVSEIVIDLNAHSDSSDSDFDFHSGDD